MSGPVSFLSDFSHHDEFIGVVHGVISKISPDVRVIDVIHEIPRGAIRAGALALTRAIQYLPSGVVLAVVDPGVGTERKALAIETAWGHFVGPDNGLVSPAVAMVGGATKAVGITNPDVIIPSAGATFQGRDVFAPAAALLASGEAQLSELGPNLDLGELTPLLLPLPEIEQGRVSGEVWWIDVYGNAEMNMGPDELRLAGWDEGSELTVAVGATRHEVRWVAAYAELSVDELGLVVDSAGLMALTLNRGNAAAALNVGDGTAVTVLAQATS